MRDLLIAILPGETGSVGKPGPALRRLCGKPSLRIVCEAAGRAAPGGVLVVGAPDPAAARQALDGEAAEFVGEEAAGAADGADFLAAVRRLAPPHGDVMILPANAPLVTPGCLSGMLAHHRKTGSSLTIAAGESPGSAPWIGCFRSSRLIESLEAMRLAGLTAPLTLADLCSTKRQAAEPIEAYLPADPETLRPALTEEDLARASRHLRLRKCAELMAAGVQIPEPALAFIDLAVAVEEGALIHPLVTLEGVTRIGAGSVIHSGTRISDSTIGSCVRVLDSCVITDSRVGQKSVVGPFAHLRNGADVGASCRVGNFVEIKKSTLGDGTKAAHLAYLGDAAIGRNVNIGAGTITCNYDGIRKHVTIIEDDAFIGTDSQLVAPVRIGRGAYVAAGSCITRDVPEGGLAVARSRQSIKEGWAHRLKKKE